MALFQDGKVSIGSFDHFSRGGGKSLARRAAWLNAAGLFELGLKPRLPAPKLAVTVITS